MERLGLKAVATSEEIAAAAAAEEAAVAGAGGVAAAGAGAASAEGAAAGAGAGLLAKVGGAATVGSAVGIIGLGQGDLGAQATAKQLSGIGVTSSPQKLLAGIGSQRGVAGGSSVAGEDAALAEMVGSGNTTKAAGQFAVLAKAAASLGIPVSQLTKWFPSYTSAVSAATNAQRVQTASVVTVGDAYRSLAVAEQTAWTAQQKLATQNQSLVHTEDAAATAVAGLGKALDLHNLTLRGDSAAAVQNREAILAVVQAAQAHGAAINADGKHAAEAAVYTDRFALSLEANLVKFGMSKSAADRYIKTLLGMPKSASLTVALHDAQAKAYLDSIRSKMNNLNGIAATVYVNAVANGVSTGQAAQQGKNAAMFGGKADGGTIGMADGGTPHFAGTVSGPGNAAADLAGIFRLANGEEVTSNKHGQADAFRPVLKAIGSQQVRTMGDLAALLGANRGPVTTKTVNVGGVHMHNPVAVDPVQSAEDASQTITAYAGIL
jgi:hypothetical protein